MTYRDSNSADAPAEHTGRPDQDILSAAASETFPGTDAATVERAAGEILWSATAHAFVAVATAGHGLALAGLLFGYAPPAPLAEECAALEVMTGARAEPVALEGEALDIMTFAPAEPVAVAAEDAVASEPAEAVAEAIEAPETSDNTEPLSEASGVSGDLIAAATPEAIRAGDDLTLIRGIDDKAAAILHNFGIVHFRDIAAFQAEDARIVSQALGDGRRLSRECWIEQAALLAKGIMTSYARTRLVEIGEPAIVLAFRAPEAETTVVDTGMAETAAAPADAVTAEKTGSEPAGETVAEPVSGAGAAVAAGTPEASNVIPFPKQAKPARKPFQARRWAAFAASLAVMAAVAASTFGIKPAFAQYLEGFGCTGTLIGISLACEQLSWLTD